MRNLSVHNKVRLILAVTVLPVVGLLFLYLIAVRQLLAVEGQVDRIFAVQVLTESIMAQVLDVQDGFRGFVLTRNESFLVPFYTAEEGFDPALHRLKEMVRTDPEDLRQVTEMESEVRALLQKKRQLIDAVRFGDMKPVREHIESGEGHRALEHIQAKLTAFESGQSMRLRSQQERAERWARVTSYGLLAGILGILALWALSTRLLARTITGPLATLTAAAQQFGSGRPVAAISVDSQDEIGRLARTMEEMQIRIAQDINLMDAFHSIGRAVATIGPDGPEGVLKRIAERAGVILSTDLCLVLLWDEVFACWKVGAASGPWHDLLRRSVLVREDAPVFYQVLCTGIPQTVKDLTVRPEAAVQLREHLGARDLLAVPLRDQTGTFGVLALASIRDRRIFTEWEVRLAQQFADLAAIAILNAHLYEAAHQRGEGLQHRLQELEGYASNMAHDLKGPARRMAELASLLQIDYKGRLDDRADRYLSWIQTNGEQLMARIEEVLRLARIGSVQETVEPVDPGEVVQDVLQGCAEEIQRLVARVRVAKRFPRLVCNRIHLYQILDNLIRNGLKFAAPGALPQVEVGVEGAASEAALFVRDNGIGISASDQERIFQPFERVGEHDAPGTGIGLTIVKRIIELYRGRIWVKSERGGGSTFFFTLPLHGEVATELSSQREARP